MLPLTVWRSKGQVVGGMEVSYPRVIEFIEDVKSTCVKVGDFDARATVTQAVATAGECFEMMNQSGMIVALK